MDIATPPARRKRGRPATGGRKPRARSGKAFRNPMHWTPERHMSVLLLVALVGGVWRKRYQRRPQLRTTARLILDLLQGLDVEEIPIRSVGEITAPLPRGTISIGRDAWLWLLPRLPRDYDPLCDRIRLARRDPEAMRLAERSIQASPQLYPSAGESP